VGEELRERGRGGGDRGRKGVGIEFGEEALFLFWGKGGGEGDEGIFIDGEGLTEADIDSIGGV